MPANPMRVKKVLDAFTILFKVSLSFFAKGLYSEAFIALPAPSCSMEIYPKNPLIELHKPLMLDPNVRIIILGITKPDKIDANSSNNEKPVLIIALFFLIAELRKRYEENQISERKSYSSSIFLSASHINLSIAILFLSSIKSANLSVSRSADMLSKGKT